MDTSIAYRILPNGDVFVPRRGKAPPVPEGYIRDSGDPWLFHIDLSPCVHRVEKLDPGCKCKYVLWCEKLNKAIKQLVCKECV